RVETCPVFSAIGEMKIGLISQAIPTVTATDRANTPMPSQSSAFLAVNIMFRFASTPVVNTNKRWTMMNTTKYSIVTKWILRAASKENALLTRLACCGHQVDRRSPEMMAIGAAIKMVMK